MTLLFVVLNSIGGWAQRTGRDSLNASFVSYTRSHLQEKIFAHLDRSFYVAGENMWFKLYNVDGYFHRPLDVSKVAYLDILDMDQNSILQTKVNLQNGVGNGQVLIPISVASGNYLVRAYTSWMKNFSPEFYFQQPITILNTVRKTDLPEKKNATEYDIQFFPEGGHLVDGIASTVAFRIVDQRGLGSDLKGAILNQKGDTISTFKPFKFGIGKFRLLPSISEQYRVVFRSQSGTISAKLPTIESWGYVMHVSDTLSNQLRIAIHSKGVMSSAGGIYFLAHTRQVLKISEEHAVDNGATVFVIDKSRLGEGISHLTIFNTELQPLCERLIFIPPTRKLSLAVQTDAKKYSSRKPIKLDAAVTNNTFKSGSFSLSVYKADSLEQFPALDIQSYELLTSDLKGNIESPSFYFSNDARSTEAADNLMLTHGWSRFKWNDLQVLKSQTFTYPPEYRGHLITGSMINTSSGGPAPGMVTYLSIPGRNVKLYTARSDANGRIQFEVQNLPEKGKIYVQPNLSVDSIYRFEAASPFSGVTSTYKLPPLRLTSSLKEALIARSISMQTESTYKGPKSIATRNFFMDSTAFYGQADERYLLDDYTRFSVMEEVMREYVHGVWVRKKAGKFIFKVPDEPHHGLFENESLVLLDGVPIFNVDKIMAFSPLKVQKLDVLTRKYFLGPMSFEGVVSYSTYKGDLGGFELDPKITVLDYQGLQAQKEFFSPRYETPDQVESRLADRRNLLYWSGDINLTGQQHLSIEFYSSDETGRYNVLMQGVTSDGLAGSGTTSFEVIAPENN